MSFTVKKLGVSSNKITKAEKETIRQIKSTKSHIKSVGSVKSDFSDVKDEDLRNMLLSGKKLLTKARASTKTAPSKIKEYEIKTDKKYRFVEAVEENRHNKVTFEYIKNGKIIKGTEPDSVRRFYKYSEPIEFKTIVKVDNLTSLPKEVKAAKELMQKQIQEKRVKQRELITEEKTFRHSRTNATFSYKLPITPSFQSSPVFPEGFVRNILNALQAQKVFEPKAPKTDDNYVGVEIEFVSKTDKNTLAGMLFQAGLANYVELKSDGSLRAEGEYTKCHELCVLVTEEKAKEVINKVISVLDAAQSIVNKSCGLHVHLDMRNRNHKVVFNNLVKGQDILFAMNSRHRIDGTFSKKVSTADFDEFLGASGGSRGDRYYGINGMAYSRHQTIEIRIHSGSTNADKINNWISILTGIANKKHKLVNPIDTVESLVEKFELDSSLTEYINMRIEKFRDNKTGQHIEVQESA